MTPRSERGGLQPAWCAVIWTLIAALLTTAIWIGGIWRDVEANTAFREQAQPRLERMETILERMDGVLQRLEQQFWEQGRSQTSGHPVRPPALRLRPGQAPVLTATTGPRKTAPCQPQNHPQTTDGK
ncbi:hypothetical protein ACI3L3_10160 [Desulfobaculum sp. SPO524]|uniref:hypothetical protein n=1 Tax=Desulfobaculum sp. SPO524 TaxID=3378071 RepID=UPI0038529934